MVFLKRQNLDPYRFCHENWRLEKYEEMFEMMGALITVKQSGYDYNTPLKGPKHGPYETVFNKTTGKEMQVCLCEMCGKKNIHKPPGPAPNKRFKSNTDIC